MHWVIKEQLNKLNSNHYRDLVPFQIDHAISNAQDLLLEDVLNDPKSFEKVTQASNIADSLIEKSKAIPLTLVDDTNADYRVYKGVLPDDFFYHIRSYAQTDCGIVQLLYSQHQDLNNKLKNAFFKPSAKWGRRLFNYAQKSIFVYVEKTLSPVEVWVEYIRYPKRVFFGGYDSMEYVYCISSGGTGCNAFYKTTDAPVNCEINDHYHNTVADYAVRELSRNLEDVNKVQLIQDKILTTLN